MGEPGNAQIQQIVNPSTRYDYERAGFVIDIKNEVEGLEPLTLSKKCCIYKMPDSLRGSKEEAYIPQVISIGPLHHCDKKLQSMEKNKVRYLKDFLKRPNINLEDLVSKIEELEEQVRLHYEDTISLERYDFIKMILVDATFIIELFVRYKKSAWTKDDKMVLKPILAARIQFDLLLLENQLPLFIIEEMYEFASKGDPSLPSFMELTYNYFDFQNKQKLSPDKQQRIIHFVDLLRMFYLPKGVTPQRKPNMVGKMYSVAQLYEVGLKLEENRSSKCLLDLDYKKGVLKIPCFTMDNITELYARNLIAFEQCHYPNEAYVTDYFIMLDLLVRSEKDVDLLARKGIITNGLGNNDATVINNLGGGISYSNMSSDYHDIRDKLVKFYENRSHHWLASLKWNYLRNPWVILSTITAIVLLVLTIIQTVCSAISVV